MHLDLGQAGNLFLAMNFAMLISGLVAGPFMDRFGKKPVLVSGPVFVAAALALMAVAADYATLMASVGLLGFGGGELNSGTNTLVADLHSDARAKSSALNLLGIFFGFGALFLPFVIGSLVKTLGLALILYITVGLSLPACDFVRRARLSAVKAPTGTGDCRSRPPGPQPARPCSRISAVF